MMFKHISKDQKKWLSIAIVSLVVIGILLLLQKFQHATPQSSDSADVAAITQTIEHFGLALKQVSILAPTEDLNTSIVQNYKAYITPHLLNTWLTNSTLVPGRETSNPFPDTIEITNITKVTSTSYMIVGTVTEVAQGPDNKLENVDTYPISASVVKIKGIWLIDAFNNLDKS